MKDKDKIIEITENQKKFAKRNFREEDRDYVCELLQNQADLILEQLLTPSDYRRVDASKRLPNKGGQYHIILESDNKEFLDRVGIDSGTNTSAFFWKSKKEWWKKDEQIFPKYWLEPTPAKPEQSNKVHDIDEFYKDEEFSPVDLTNVEPDRIKSPTEDNPILGNNTSITGRAGYKDHNSLTEDSKITDTEMWFGDFIANQFIHPPFIYSKGENYWSKKTIIKALNQFAKSDKQSEEGDEILIYKGIGTEKEYEEAEKSFENREGKYFQLVGETGGKKSITYVTEHFLSEFTPPTEEMVEIQLDADGLDFEEVKPPTEESKVDDAEGFQKWLSNNGYYLGELLQTTGEGKTRLIKVVDVFAQFIQSQAK